MKELKEMKLHETVWLKNGTLKIVRVPGGWVYTNALTSDFDKPRLISSCFVPDPTGKI